MHVNPLANAKLAVFLSTRLFMMFAFACCTTPFAYGAAFELAGARD